MTREEDFFKENFPEYVTEKGECLSPYWDLFNAGVICATFELKVRIEQLEKLDEAKEIIKGLFESCFGYNSKSVNYEIKAKAEQFLKEIEK